MVRKEDKDHGLMRSNFIFSKGVTNQNINRSVIFLESNIKLSEKTSNKGL